MVPFMTVCCDDRFRSHFQTTKHTKFSVSFVRFVYFVVYIAAP